MTTTTNTLAEALRECIAALERTAHSTEADRLAAADKARAALAQAEAKPLPEAMKVVTEALRADPDYAWSWHCNITMSMVDEGIDQAAAEHGAQRFLNLLCGPGPALVPAHPIRDKAEAKPAPAEPAAWLVLDESGALVHAAAYRESAHEHINDAINEHGITEAARWVVRPAFAAAPATPAPVEAIREVIRISDRDHNAWNAVKSWLAAAPAAPGVQVVVERERVWIKRGVQSFGLAYEADTDAEREWYAGQLRTALAAPAAPAPAEPLAPATSALTAAPAAPAEPWALSKAAQSVIGAWLAKAMDEAVENGANSISMPDEFVEIAAMLAAAPAAPTGHVTVCPYCESEWVTPEQHDARVAALAAAPAAPAPTDPQIAAAVRPLYQSDEAAAMGLADDIRTVRAVIAAIAASKGEQG